MRGHSTSQWVVIEGEAPLWPVQRSKMKRFGKIVIICKHFCKKVHLKEGSEYVPGFKYVRVLNIPKFAHTWQGSEYALGCNYRRVLNIPGFRLSQIFAYASVAEGSECAWIWLNNVLWQGSEYAWSTFLRVLNKLPAGSKYIETQNMAMLWICKCYTGSWICLNKYY